MEYTELELPKRGDSVLVAMSGGVDSTYAALMLHEMGCRVAGVTMAMWDESFPLAARTAKHPSCYSSDEKQEIAAVKAFCKKLGINHIVADVREAYRSKVIEYFKAEYRAGRTPNPCIRCNREVKFGAMLRAAQDAGEAWDYFCTGHYARIVRPCNALWTSGKKPAMVAAAVDKTKDQSYFLCGVPSEILERVRFPLGGMTKAQVRKAALQAGLHAAEKEESQDFMGGAERSSLFGDRPKAAGNIVDVHGKVLGRHTGIEHYTIGQRRALGVSSAKPLYVKAIDVASNTVVVSDEEGLHARSLLASDAVWPLGAVPPASFEAEVKIRLKSPPAHAIVESDAASFTVRFTQDVRAVAPGQSAVIYIDGVVHGAGVIAK